MEAYSGVIALLIVLAIFVAVSSALKSFKTSGIVQTLTEGERGVVYRYGKFDQELGPGRHYMVFGREMRRVQISEQSMIVSNQEVLTADRLPVRLSALLTYKISHPRKALEKAAGGFFNPVYYAAQLTLRDVAAEMPLEALVDARTTLDATLLERTKSAFVEHGCELLSMAIRDIVLPAEVRRLATDVTRARMEGLAALERARGEQASLRALANAARLLKGNPELMNLRLLQAVTAQPGKTAPTVVLGGATGILPVATGAADQPDPGPEPAG